MTEGAPRIAIKAWRVDNDKVLEHLSELIGEMEEELADAPGLELPKQADRGRATLDNLMARVLGLATSVLALDDKPDPPEYQEPVGPDQLFQNGRGQIAVRVYLHDPYQQKLLEAGWLQQFVDELCGYPELSGKTLRMELRPRFNKAVLDSGTGYVVGTRDDQRNTHKNRFLLDVTWELPPDAPMDVTYHYEIQYYPGSRDYTYQILDSKVLYFWKPGADLEEDVERRLLDSGILKEVVLDPQRPDRELAKLSVEGIDDRPHLIPVRKQQHVLSVAIDNPRSFPADLKSWQAGIVEPVLVREREQLEAFRENLYSGLVVTRRAFLRGYRFATSSRLKEISKADLTSVLASLDAVEHYDFEYRHHRLGRLQIHVSLEQVVVQANLGFMNSNWPPLYGCFEGATPSGTWNALEKLAESDAIWQPDGRRTTGETWTLNRTGPTPRNVKLWSVFSGPLLEFCFELMRLVGLEPHVERYVHWHEPGQEW